LFVEVLLESLFLDDPAQIGAMQLIKLAADKPLNLTKSVAEPQGVV